MILAATVNGQAVRLDVEPQELLLDVLRERLGLTGAKRSCDVQVCGTCTVLADGQPISSCCTLAVDADGRELTTIEGFASQPEFAAIEEAFTRRVASQCGFCTPGMVLTVGSLLGQGRIEPGEEGARRAVEGNICRCTGYRAILDAVRELADR